MEKETQNIPPTREIVEGNLARMTGSSSEDMPKCLNSEMKCNKPLYENPDIPVPVAFYFQEDTGKIEYFVNIPEDTRKNMPSLIRGIFLMKVAREPNEKTTITKKKYLLYLDTMNPQSRVNLRESVSRYNQL